MTDENTQREYADTILAEGERLGRLVDNVLDFAKIEQGKRRLYRLRTAALAEVVRSAIRALEKPLAQQGFTLELKMEESIPEVQADADALMRAILNLLTNAMKYSGTSRQIELKLTQRRRHAVIQVRDFGFGLPPEELEKVFEKFYRAPQPEGESVPGTGLGLTIVKHVAEEHGGSVEVRSEPGKGSTFSILIPLD
jgi:two-component system, OmpR family, phosphate regulon sensor histidine kinase PhoR